MVHRGKTISKSMKILAFEYKTTDQISFAFKVFTI